MILEVAGKYVNNSTYLVEWVMTFLTLWNISSAITTMIVEFAWNGRETLLRRTTDAEELDSHDSCRGRSVLTSHDIYQKHWTFLTSYRKHWTFFTRNWVYYYLPTSYGGQKGDIWIEPGGACPWGTWYLFLFPQWGMLPKDTPTNCTCPSWHTCYPIHPYMVQCTISFLYMAVYIPNIWPQTCRMFTIFTSNYIGILI